MTVLVVTVADTSDRHEKKKQFSLSLSLSLSVCVRVCVMYNSWQYAKHAGLYFDLPQAFFNRGECL